MCEKKVEGQWFEGQWFEGDAIYRYNFIDGQFILLFHKDIFDNILAEKSKKYLLEYSKGNKCEFPISQDLFNKDLVKVVKYNKDRDIFIGIDFLTNINVTFLKEDIKENYKFFILNSDLKRMRDEDIKRQWFDGIEFFERIRDNKIITGDFLKAKIDDKYIDTVVSIDHEIVNTKSNKALTITQIVNKNNKFRLKTCEELNHKKYTFYEALIDGIGKNVKIKYTGKYGNDYMKTHFMTIKDMINYLKCQFLNDYNEKMFKEKAWVIVND